MSVDKDVIYVLSVVSSNGTRKPATVYKDYDLARKDVAYFQKENPKVCLSLQPFEVQNEEI